MTVPALFVLTPDLVDQDGVLDYSDAENVKLYKATTASLYPNADEYYDGSPDKFPDFLNLLSHRADDYV